MFKCLEEITKEQVIEMSIEEVKLWYDKMAQEDMAEAMRKDLLKQLDIQEAELNTIKIK